MGIPSSFNIFQLKGCTTSPSLLVIVTILPSRCLIYLVNPSTASCRLMSMFMYKLLPTRLKTGCSFCFKVKMMSLWTISTIYSPCLSNLMLSPEAIPRSISTTTLLPSLTSLLP
jgi:hypothetical protein